MEQHILRNTIETEERERQRFSEDLHDGLGPLLSTAKIYLELIAARMEKPIEQKEFIKMTDDILYESIKSTREIANNLAPNLLNDFGLIETLSVYVDKINKIKGFNQLDDSVKAVLRPENVNITRLDEKVDSAASVEKGVVVGKLFMGKEVEITVNVNGIEVVGTRNVEEAPIKKGEEVNVFIHRAFTYGADGIVNIVENANKFEDWMVM